MDSLKEVNEQPVFLMNQIRRLTEAVMPCGSTWAATKGGIEQYISDVIARLKPPEGKKWYLVSWIATHVEGKRRLSGP